MDETLCAADQELQRLKDAHQAARNELAAFGAKIDADGRAASPEEVEQFNALKAKAEKARGDAEQFLATYESERARADRLNAVKAAQEFGDKFDRALLRTPDRRASVPGRREPATEHDLELAFAAWQAALTPEAITEEQARAAARLGVNPAAKEFRLANCFHPKQYERFLQATAGRMGNPLYEPLAGATDYLDSRDPQYAGYINRPPVYLQTFERNLTSFGGVLTHPIQIVVTPGYETLKENYGDDSQTKGYRIKEGGSIGTVQNPKVAEIEWTYFLYSSGQISYTTIQLAQARFSLDALVSDVHAERLGRVLADELTTGSGVGQPEGYHTACERGGLKVTVTAVPLATATAAEMKNIEDAVRNLEYKLDEMWVNSPSFGWSMHRNTLAYLEGIETADGVKRFMLGWETATNRRTLRNKPIYLNYSHPSPDFLAAAGSNATARAGKTAITAGAFDRFRVRRAGGGTPMFVRDEVTGINELKVKFTTIIAVDAKLRNWGNSPLAELELA